MKASALNHIDAGNSQSSLPTSTCKKACKHTHSWFNQKKTQSLYYIICPNPCAVKKISFIPLSSFSRASCTAALIAPSRQKQNAGGSGLSQLAPFTGCPLSGPCTGSVVLQCSLSVLHPQRVLHYIQGWWGQPANDTTPELGEQQVWLWQRLDCHDGPLHCLDLWGLARVSASWTCATVAISSFISKEKFKCRA